MRATTTPVEENQANPCHFVIVPTEESIDDLLIMLPHFMAAQFPPVKPGKQPPKKPRTGEDKRKALEARARYDRVLRIIRNVKVVPRTTSESE
jgi:hypothetical protein